MRAVLFPGHSRTEMVNIVPPTPSGGEILIRLTASGVCGTDVHYWHQSAGERGPRGAIVPGHEAVGVTAAVGEGVHGFAEGDRVVCGMLHIGCGQCRVCARGNFTYCPDKEVLGRTLHGSYGEYICVPAQAVFPLPGQLSDSAAVLAACNLATAYSAFSRTRVLPRERMAVFGLGGVGLSAVIVGGHFATDVIAIDPVAQRRDKALSLGAWRAYHPDEYAQLLREGMSDVIVSGALECSGHPKAQIAAIDALEPGGGAVLVGMGGRLDFAPELLIAKGATLTGSSVCRRDEFFSVLDVAETHQMSIESLFGPRLSIDEVDDALEHTASHSPGKVLFEWSE